MHHQLQQKISLVKFTIEYVVMVHLFGNIDANIKSSQN
jgi:hypothetical protein